MLQWIYKKTKVGVACRDFQGLPLYRKNPASQEITFHDENETKQQQQKNGLLKDIESVSL